MDALASPAPFTRGRPSPEIAGGFLLRQARRGSRTAVRVCGNGEESGMLGQVRARIRRAVTPNSVMAGLGPAIHELLDSPHGREVVDAKDKPWHDEGESRGDPHLPACRILFVAAG